MGTVTFSRPRTKKCPFCGERIQGRAIKCRYCAEFLNTDEAKALEADSARNSQPSEERAENVLFEGRPSLLGMVGAAIKAMLFLCLAVFLIAWPLETLLSGLLGLDLSDSQALVFREYRIIAGLGLAVVVILLLLLKVVKLKMTYYEVTAERIEWTRGVFDRKVDNLDMFRVVDLKMRRSLLDCILGIGRVELITTDKTDPEFTFEKMRHSRRLYDAIKKASLAADHRDGVIHIE